MPALALLNKQEHENGKAEPGTSQKLWGYDVMLVVKSLEVKKGGMFCGEYCFSFECSRVRWSLGKDAQALEKEVTGGEREYSWQRQWLKPSEKGYRMAAAANQWAKSNTCRGSHPYRRWIWVSLPGLLSNQKQPTFEFGAHHSFSGILAFLLLSKCSIRVTWSSLLVGSITMIMWLKGSPNVLLL